MKILKSNCKGADESYEGRTYVEESPYEDAKPIRPLNDLGLLDEKSSSQSQNLKGNDTMDHKVGTLTR